MTDEQLRKIADELGEPIEIVRSVSDAMAVCVDEVPSEAREQRRQAAREAAYDAEPDEATMHYDRASINAAIESAITVEITDELVAAARDRIDERASSESIESALRAAFADAGFVVVP